MAKWVAWLVTYTSPFVHTDASELGGHPRSCRKLPAGACGDHERGQKVGRLRALFTNGTPPEPSQSSPYARARNAASLTNGRLLFLVFLIMFSPYYFKVRWFDGLCIRLSLEQVARDEFDEINTGALGTTGHTGNLYFVARLYRDLRNGLSSPTGCPLIQSPSQLLPSADRQG